MICMYVAAIRRPRCLICNFSRLKRSAQKRRIPDRNGKIRLVRTGGTPGSQKVFDLHNNITIWNSFRYIKQIYMPDVFIIYFIGYHLNNSAVLSSRNMPYQKNEHKYSETGISDSCRNRLRLTTDNLRLTSKKERRP